MRLLAGQLEKDGFDVEFVALDKPDSKSEFFAKSARYTTIDSPFLDLLIGRFGARLASRRHYHQLLRQALWLSTKASFKQLRYKQPTVVHYIGTGWSRFGFALAKLACEKNARFSVWPAVHPHNWGDDEIDIFFYNCSGAVFCQSEFEKQHLQKLGVDTRKLIRVGLPPMCLNDGMEIRLRQQLALDDRPVVLFLGRRDKGKGYFALVEAWETVCMKVPAAVLVLAGPGDPAQVLVNRIPSANVRDLGVPDERTKADALAMCDVFCLPSEHESFGIVYVEAWSYGKPVICGTAPASRELVEDNVTGIHSSQNTTELAVALVRILRNPARSAELGRVAKQLQTQKYTEAEMYETHLRAWNLR